MRQPALILLFSLPFLYRVALGADSHQSLMHCQQVFREITDSGTNVYSSLEGVLELRALVIDVAGDPKTPPRIKQLLIRAVRERNLTVSYMSEAVAALRSDFAYFQGAFEPFEAVSASRLREIRSGRGGVEHETDPRWARPRVVVRNESGSKEDSVLLSFIHELAHVRMSGFLAKHLPELASRWPQYVHRTADGKYAVYDQFLTYLHERYAFEMEHFALEKLRPQFREDWLRQFDGSEAANRLKATPGRDARRSLSEVVTELYRLDDPELKALFDRSLSEILKPYKSSR